MSRVEKMAEIVGPGLRHRGSRAPFAGQSGRRRSLMAADARDEAGRAIARHLDARPEAGEMQPTTPEGCGPGALCVDREEKDPALGLLADTDAYSESEKVGEPRQGKHPGRVGTRDARNDDAHPRLPVQRIELQILRNRGPDIAWRQRPAQQQQVRPGNPQQRQVC